MKPSTAERGYGRAHQRARAEYVARFVSGDPCARCGRPILDVATADLDHTEDRAGYMGLSHRACNRSARAGGKRRRFGRVCDGCGLTFTTNYGDQKFCTAACRWQSRTPREPKVRACRDCPAPVEPRKSLCATCRDARRGEQYEALKVAMRNRYARQRGRRRETAA